MRREDHGARIDHLQASHAVVGINQRNAVVFELIGDVLVVDQVAKHLHRLRHSCFARLRAHLAGYLDGVYNAMAVTARGDLDDLHASIMAVRTERLVTGVRQRGRMWRVRPGPSRGLVGLPGGRSGADRCDASDGRAAGANPG